MLKILRIIVIFMLTFAIFGIVGLFAQDPSAGTGGADFPYVLFLPLFGGMIAHWLKGYARGTINDNIFSYLVNNIGQSSGAIIAAVGQLILAWQAAPQTLSPVTIVVLWTVFNMGYVADSAVNGTGPFIKK